MDRLPSTRDWQRAMRSREPIFASVNVSRGIVRPSITTSARVVRRLVARGTLSWNDGIAGHGNRNTPRKCDADRELGVDCRWRFRHRHSSLAYLQRFPSTIKIDSPSCATSRGRGRVLNRSSRWRTTSLDVVPRRGDGSMRRALIRCANTRKALPSRAVDATPRCGY